MKHVLANTPATCAQLIAKLETAEWAPIPGHPGYAVSDWGHVYSFPKSKRIRGGGQQPLPGRYMKLGRRPDGYFEVRLGRGKENHWLVHRLVALAFLGPCPSGYVVDHINADRGDTRLQNLRYITKAENDAQRWREVS